MTFRSPDRLYELLPYVYRLRDAERGYPLQALLRLVGSQVALIEEDIDRLYDNWFIETCEPWVVPYIGDLIGYQPVAAAGQAGEVSTFEGRLRNRALVPRREVASTVALRRRKGTLAVLETLAYDVAAWPARAVEYYTLLAVTQPVRAARLDRGRTADVRLGDALTRLGGAFDEIARNVDVRRISSAHDPGRHNIPSVGLHVFRLHAFPITRAQAYCHEAVGKSAGQSCFTFSILGNDAPLFTRAEREEDAATIAGELNVPAPIRRRALAAHLAAYYGEDKSFAIWRETADPRGSAPTRATLVPLEQIVVADLSEWFYRARGDAVAVDPELGRVAFAGGDSTLKGVRVSYRYGFSAAIGGGEYERPLPEPVAPVRRYEVGPGCYPGLREAVAAWQADHPARAIIEIADSAVYSAALKILLDENQSLEIRAANRARPVIRLLDYQPDATDAMSVYGKEGSSLTLDGLLVMGRGVTVQGPLARLTLRHTTLVPGWDLLRDRGERASFEPSLLVSGVTGSVHIAKSIVGPLRFEIDGEPLRLTIEDSVVDAGALDGGAISGPEDRFARVTATLRRITVLGRTAVHAVELVENSLFGGCLQVARRQTGCVRFSYVAADSRTPPRHQCQPDLALARLTEDCGCAAADGAELGTDEQKSQRERLRELERTRVRPLWASVRYGTPSYAKLADACAVEIARGADDESEMGVFHDLFLPQRAANLTARVAEYTPAGSDPGILYAT